jgi:tetratricopeptide (TPR) repeat protein
VSHRQKHHQRSHRRHHQQHQHQQHHCHHHHHHHHPHDHHCHHDPHHNEEENDVEQSSVETLHNLGQKTYILNTYQPLSFELCNQYINQEVFVDATEHFKTLTKSPILKERFQSVPECKNYFAHYTPQDKEFLDKVFNKGMPEFETVSPIQDIMACSPTESQFSSNQLLKATEKACEGYSLLLKGIPDYNKATQLAKEALEMSDNKCVEAYNVLALTYAKNFEEALEFYRTAQKYGNELTKNPISYYEKKGECWLVPELRSYLRAVIGEANTLRKMRRLEEALKVYERLMRLDDNYYMYPTCINYKIQIPEIYMRLGRFKDAKDFLIKNNSIIGRMSEITLSWNRALCDYVLSGRKDKWAEEFFNDTNQMASVGPGAVLRAIITSPLVYDYLTGVKKLTPSKISALEKLKGGECPKTQQICYALSHIDLWLSQPGAIEWLNRNYNTLMMLFFVKNAAEEIKKFNINEQKYWECSKYFYPNAKVTLDGLTLFHLTCLNGDDPKKVKMMLDAGATQKTSFHSSPLQMSCYYDKEPKIIALLIENGADPFAGHFSAYAMACNQGTWRPLKTILTLAPKHKITQNLLSEGFLLLFRSSVYGCLKGYKKCRRCLSDSQAHTPHTSFENCVDVLLSFGLKVSQKDIDILRAEIPPWTLTLLDYTLQRMSTGHNADALVLDLNTSDLEHTNVNMPVIKSTTNAKSENKQCHYCKKQDVKLMLCSRCKQAFYCSKECQLNHWKTHKLFCQKK